MALSLSEADISEPSRAAAMAPLLGELALAPAELPVATRRVLEQRRAERAAPSSVSLGEAAGEAVDDEDEVASCSRHLPTTSFETDAPMHAGSYEKS